MKTRKIKGGYIEKIDDKWTIMGSNGNSTVNEYRRLELIELDKLAIDSKSTNSNTVLEGNEMESKYDKMCDKSPDDPTVDIEDTKKNMRSIIDLRYQESIHMFKHDETLEQKRSRIGHEYRLKLWRYKYKIIRQIYFDHYGENTDVELSFLSSEKKTLLEKKIYLKEQLDIMNTNISIINSLFEELTDLSKDLDKLSDNRNRINDIFYQLKIDDYNKKEMSQWIQAFVKEKEAELNGEQTERKRELEQLMIDIESQLNEVEVEITTPLKTPQKPTREQLEGENLWDKLGAEELSPVKTKEVKKTKEEEEQIALEEGRLLFEKEKRELIVLDLFEWEIKRLIINYLEGEFKKTKNTDILKKIIDFKKNNIKMIKLKESYDTVIIQELKQRIVLEIEILKKHNEAYVKLKKDFESLKETFSTEDQSLFNLIHENEKDRDRILERIKIDGKIDFIDKYKHGNRILNNIKEVKLKLFESTGYRYDYCLDMTPEIEHKLIQLLTLYGGKRKTYKKKKTRKNKRIVYENKKHEKKK